MAASLAGLEHAGADPARQQQVLDRLLLAYALVLGWGGIPVIWMGDELALTNDPDWADEDGHAGDNRWTHRPPMDWTVAALRHDPASVPGRMFSRLRGLAGCRAGLPQLHASMPAEVLEPADPGVLPVLRPHPIGPLLGLYNVTSSWRPVPLRLVAELGLADGTDAISGRPVRGADGAGLLGGDGALWLAPYAAHWLVG
jgi:amylosucrase